jgi:outer membrane protein
MALPAKKLSIPEEHGMNNQTCCTAYAHILSSAFALTLLAIPAAQAQQSTAGSEPNETMRGGGPQWGVGIGAGLERKPYRAFDDDPLVLPLLFYVNRYVSVLGPGVDVHLPSTGPVLYRLRLRYAGDGYEADDSPYLAGMAERKASFWLGGAATWRSEIANFSAELLADASRNSKGTRFKVQVDRRFTMGAVGLTPRVSAQRLDDKYVDYYYGVRAAEVRPDRARFNGTSTVNVELGMRLDYAFTPKHDVFVDLSATRLGSGIKDSPLVERSSSTALRVGYLYRF